MNLKKCCISTAASLQVFHRTDPGSPVVPPRGTVGNETVNGSSPGVDVGASKVARRRAVGGGAGGGAKGGPGAAGPDSDTGKTSHQTQGSVRVRVRPHFRHKVVLGLG